jgi:hypothetical protein
MMPNDLYIFYTRFETILTYVSDVQVNFLAFP